MRRSTNTHARLFLNEHDVGVIEVKGWDDSWGFGEFAAGDSFWRYARHFGDWSRLIHAPREDDRLTDADKAALRKAEYEIDRLHAKLFLVESREWRKISELNIDGELVEWREEYQGEAGPRAA
jgi:hypothetical protein